MQFNKNDTIVLNIDDLSSEGEGIGHIDGYAFFVKGALIGETIEAIITKCNKNFGYAKMTDIMIPSRERVKPECKYYNQCGGCNIQHINYEGQKKYKYNKVKMALSKFGKIDIDEKSDKAENLDNQGLLGAEEVFRYRNKAQYPVGEDKKGRLIAGFYARRSHRIIDIDDCLLEPEINGKIVKAILDFSQGKIRAYNERSHKGALRHIMIRHAYGTNEIMVSLVLNGKNLKDTGVSKKFVEGLIGEVKSVIDESSKSGKTYILKSFSLNYNNDKTNVIMGNKTEVFYGEELIIDEMNGLKYAISPNSFYQVNYDQASKLYQKTAEFAAITNDDIVFDLYCGTGTIGLYLAKKAKKVYGVEIVPEAIEMAKINKKLNNIDNAEFFVGSADDVADKLIKDNIIPNVVVVDPPRKGCTPDLLETILKIKPERIVYVSCDPATMARDVKILTDSDEYEMTKIECVDQFCQTTHVEACVALRRKD